MNQNLSGYPPHPHHVVGAQGPLPSGPLHGLDTWMPAPITPLSVTDIERLAKAGVKVEWKDIAAQVQPDFKQAPLTLVEAFWQRWKRANPGNNLEYYGRVQPWQIFATTYGEKVFVYVAPIDAEPFILEDEKVLYPSDALIAKLHLREHTK